MKKANIVGLVFAAMGAAITWYGWSEMMQKAASGATSFTLSSIAPLGTVCFMAGLVLTVGGARATDYLKSLRQQGKKDLKYYGLLLLVALPAIAVYILLEMELKKMGYETKY